MKNLANCGPREFLRQTTRVRHAVKNWLTLTEIMSIRRRTPALPADLPEDERNKRLTEQARDNLDAMLDAVMEKHPDETVEVLALCCFIEPEDADDHPMSEYLGAIGEILEDQNVMRFFTSLMRLGSRLGLTA